MFPSVELRVMLLCGLLTASPALAQEVSGVLRDVAGHGISGITIQANIFSSVSFTQLVTTTDAEGRFSLPAETATWSIYADASGLNALGYLDVSPASFSVSNESKSVRFTTRRLDLGHRVIGRLVDDLQWPLPQLPLRASIDENGQRFETNFTTGFDGSFSLAVSPALWRILPSLSGGSGNRVFPEFDAAVEPTNSETQVTIVAPRVTANITGVASNLAGFEVVAVCEAFGSRYVQATYLFNSHNPFVLPVFNGVWTVSITNRSNSAVNRNAPPPPQVVNVTNGSVALQFTALPRASQVVEVLEVRVLAPDGVSITNASLNAYSAGRLLPGLPPSPGPPPSDPTVKRLQLSEGRWTISAGTSDPEGGLGWSVTRDVIVPLHGASNLSLVLPRNGIGPRVVGVVRDSDGVPLAGRLVHLQASEEETNYSASVLADANGSFTVNVVPGRWFVSLVDSVPCFPSATLTVATVDQEVELVVCPLPARTAVPLAVTVEDEAGSPELGFQVSFSSWSSYFGTNAKPRVQALVPLTAGLWTASLSQDWTDYRNDPYELLPRLKFQHVQTAPTNLVLVARVGLARIEGRLRESRGHLLTFGYVSAQANIGGTNYVLNARLGSGYFSLNVIPGDWEVAVSTWRYPSLGPGPPSAVPVGGWPSQPYVDPPSQLLRVTNGVNTCEFLAGDLPLPVTLTVSVIREDGVGLRDAVVYVPGALLNEWREVDADGIAGFNITPGNYSISASLSWRVVQWNPQLFPSVSLNLSATSNHVVLVVREPTACVRGTVSDFQGNPLPLLIQASGQVGGTNYTTGVCPDSRHEFCLPVIPGGWNVSVPDSAANDLGFRSLPGRSVEVPTSGSAPAVSLVLEPMIDDFRLAFWLPPLVTPAGELQLELRTQTALTWRIERSGNLKQWDVWSTVTTSNGVARVLHPGTPTSLPTFFRAVWLQ